MHSSLVAGRYEGRSNCGEEVAMTLPYLRSLCSRLRHPASRRPNETESRHGWSRRDETQCCKRESRAGEVERHDVRAVVVVVLQEREDGRKEQVWRGTWEDRAHVSPRLHPPPPSPHRVAVGEMVGRAQTTLAWGHWVGGLYHALAPRKASGCWMRCRRESLSKCWCCRFG